MFLTSYFLPVGCLYIPHSVSIELAILAHVDGKKMMADVAS